MTNKAITRRGFMKAAATATAALGVAGAPVLLDEVGQAFADSAPRRKKHKTACHGCTNCCPVVRVHRRRGGGEDRGRSRWPAQQGRRVPEVPFPNSDGLQSSSCAASHEKGG